jgi:hypothetical protein
MQFAAGGADVIVATRPGIRGRVLAGNVPAPLLVGAAPCIALPGATRLGDPSCAGRAWHGPKGRNPESANERPKRLHRQG